MLIGSHR